ncbi:hypothetical protein JHK85_030170 [Glycine max]|nr:hypothetical protein JHK85_030170 [Glycine max]
MQLRFQLQGRSSVTKRKQGRVKETEGVLNGAVYSHCHGFFSIQKILSLSQMQQLPAISRLRSSFLKKLPEPLRRAVADCLSSPLTSVLEPSRTLRDYLADPATTDLAYSAILGHTIAERERRYKPSEETLIQIDLFCSTIIAQCDINLNRPWSRSLNQQTGALATSTNTSPLPVSSFTSGAILKSLSYVRSLVAQHIPKRHFLPASLAGPPSASGQSLPTLSSLLSKSFNSQLCPASVTESVEKDSVTSSISKLSKIEKIDEKDELGFIAHDILQWRWLDKQQSSSMKADSDHAVNSQGMRAYNFLEVGAAALLEGDIGAKMKGQPWKYFGTDDMPYLDQLLQASPVTSFTNSASACPHLRAITASKRTKAGPRQVWHGGFSREYIPSSSSTTLSVPILQQQPLRLNPAEVCEVLAAVCSEPSQNTNVMMSTRLRNNSGKASMDVAEMLSSSKTAYRVQTFDLILNFGVHAHLLEPIIVDDASTIEEEYSQESYCDSDTQLMAQGSRKGNYPDKLDTSSAIDDFESWILNILYEILLLLVQTEEKEESVWASALSCLLYFLCDNGKIHRNRLQVLDIRVIKALIETSRKNSWAELVHCKLISMLANMLYEVPDEVVELLPSTPKFLVNQLDLIGGVQFLLREYALVNSREERKNLYSVLFDYVLHQVNENCIATGINEYSDDEIQPLASLLAQTNAAEAFHISVKLGVEGIGELLRRSIASALSRYPNSERLNMLLDFVTEKFDSLISSFTHLDEEFSHMIQITKTHKSLENVEIIALRNDIDLQAKHSWATLHSLLHSERIAYRQNGYIWLGDLLISEISGESNGTIWSNIEYFQQKFAQVGKQDSSDMSDIPLPISLMCGLLKSNHNYIRWGFLFVLERLLMRCKFLLDEYEMQQSRRSDLASGLKDWHLEKAHALIDIMSSALLFQINEKDCTNKYETDRTNILKMCDILLSQLCLRVPPAMALPNGDDMQHDRILNCFSSNKMFDSDNRALKQDTYLVDEHIEEEADGTSNYPKNYHLVRETAAMAALLLQGQAIASMQLIARIPLDLLFWPLMQLAGAATDDIALGVAVGSKGRGNLPGAASDIRATLLLLLIGKCTADPVAFEDRMMTESPEKYQHMLQNLLFKAQQTNNEKLLENPYLQMCGILQLANDLGFDL